MLIAFNNSIYLVCGLLGASLIYVFFLFAMAMFMQANFYLKSVNVNKVEKIVLTFDDGPHPIHTLSILNILDDLKVKAVFFMIGKNVKAYPKIAKEVSRRGHQLGVHSQNHKFNFGMLRGSKLEHEFNECVHEIEKATGIKPQLFRPPFGVTNPPIAKATLVHNLIVIGWSIRSLDTVAKTANSISTRVLKKLKNNSIILLHDRMGLTVEALPYIIKGIKNQGFNVGELTTLENN